jgi:hypothetical protein
MGISIRAFARVDGCDEKTVRKAITPQGDGQEPPAPADLEEIADRIVSVVGRAPYSFQRAFQCPVGERMRILRGVSRAATSGRSLYPAHVASFRKRISELQLNPARHFVHPVNLLGRQIDAVMQ